VQALVRPLVYGPRSVRWMTLAEGDQRQVRAAIFLTW
jgi:hypothetical protein